MLIITNSLLLMAGYRGSQLVIKFCNLHGESAEVSQDPVDQWKDKLLELYSGFSPRDIFNCDEVCFSVLYPKSLIPNGSEQYGVKVSKDKFSVLVCANV